MYFEDKDTAERVAEFVSLMAKNGSTPIRIEAIEREVYSRETAIKKIVMGLNFGSILDPN